ncbi:DUF3798 domain-containing protein [uncultured Peptoniphilus sp.]|uniref:DUF3798 domain-containing protein n=1 Tax=uncultured Peptoniphilus sp. TaxID=254354 RepID=UPI002805C061|nr:DUF3798 domain-containing protein [uncultured Peptoniphilus sp.]
MRKKIVRLITYFLLIGLALTGIACSKVENEAPANGSETTAEGNAAAEVKDLPKAQFETLKEGEEYHIGVVTGTVSQSEDEFRAAEAAIEEFGSDVVKNDTYPDRFEAEIETTIQKITAMADDPLMKAVIMNQSVPGTSAAFQKIREKRPDIILVNLTPQEDVIMVEGASDLVIDVDNVSRGYRVIKAAKDMGATKFAHITFPRHMSIEMLALRRAIFEEACKDLGLEFISLNAPDPTTDIGIPGAQQYIAENIQSWIDKYGKDTAFFCTNDAHTEPLLRGVAQGGAIFVEPDLPSPIMGYPNAFSVDLKDIAGDWKAINQRVNDAVVAAGGGGRMGSWAYSLGYTETRAAVDHVIKVLHGEHELTNINDITESLNKYTEGASWMSSNFIDRQNGNAVDNHVLIAQDTYVYGKGFLGMDKVEVPEKYLNLNVDFEAIEKSQEEAEGQAE